MFSDEERDALAQEILSEELDRKTSKGTAPSVFEEFLETENGEPIFVYGGTSVENYGSFRCEYMPSDVVRKIILECERFFDDVFPREDSEQRKDLIQIMVKVATRMLLLSMRDRLCDALEEDFQDSILMAKVVLSDAGARLVKSEEGTTIIADLRPDINQAASRVATKKREMLARLIKGLPHILVEREVGRPQGSTKPAEKKAQEAAEFEKKIQETIRTLLSAKGEMPTKTAVAKALNMGGLTKEGTNTSLTVFIRKIKKLGLDYEAIATRVRLNK